MTDFIITCTSFKVTSSCVCWFPVGPVAVGEPRVDCSENISTPTEKMIPPRHAVRYHPSRSALRPTRSQDHYQFNAKASKASAMTNVLMRHFRRQPCYASSANTHLLARGWKFSPSSLRTVHLPPQSRASVLFPLLYVDYIQITDHILLTSAKERVGLRWREG